MIEIPDLKEYLREIVKSLKDEHKEQIYGSPPRVSKDGKLYGAKPPDVKKIEELIKIRGL